MSELGSLYIKLGEPEGELCGCTCEVGDWAAKHIVDLTEQRDKLLAALELILEMMDLPPDRNCSCHISPPCNDCVDYSGIREAIKRAEKVLAEVKGQS